MCQGCSRGEPREQVEFAFLAAAELAAAGDASLRERAPEQQESLGGQGEMTAFRITLAVGFALLAALAIDITLASGLPLMAVGLTLFLAALAVRSRIFVLDRRRAINLASGLFLAAAADFVVEAILRDWAILAMAACSVYFAWSSRRALLLGSTHRRA